MTEISVIIPVYNVEKYLERCLDSVLRQTFDNLEILCVNDCSPDNSLIILQEYAKKDSRIKIFTHDKNKGLSASRNTGLRNATGKFIYFLDSDDWIEDDFLKKMHTAITKNNQKAVCSTNILYAYEDSSVKPLMKRNFSDVIKPYSMSCQMAWSWLLEKDFIDKFDVVFPEDLKYEDLYFFHVIIRNLENVYIINTATYYHYEN